MTSRHDQGFTLLETLVAVTILSITLVMLFRAVAGGARTIERTQRAADALALAQSLLEGAGEDQPLAPGKLAGTSKDGSHWTISMTPYQAPGAAGTSALPKAYWVAVTVQEPDRAPVVLSTLKLAGAP
jgi:prepilin-type N-terminal cleavage/methylation domain-containing protein